MKILLSISWHIVCILSWLIKISTVIHCFFLIWSLSYLVLHILNLSVSRYRLLMWVSSTWWCLLILSVKIDRIIYIYGHHVIIYDSTWIHIILYYLLCGMHYIVIIIVLTSSVLWSCLLLHFYYLLLYSALVHLISIISINYYLVYIFLSVQYYTWLIILTRFIIIYYVLVHIYFLVLTYLFLNVKNLLVTFLSFVLDNMLMWITLIRLAFIYFLYFYSTSFVL